MAGEFDVESLESTYGFENVVFQTTNDELCRLVAADYWWIACKTLGVRRTTTNGLMFTMLTTTVTTTQDPGPEERFDTLGDDMIHEGDFDNVYEQFGDRDDADAVRPEFTDSTPTTDDVTYATMAEEIMKKWAMDHLMLYVGSGVGVAVIILMVISLCVCVRKYCQGHQNDPVCLVRITELFCNCMLLPCRCIRIIRRMCCRKRQEQNQQGFAMYSMGSLDSSSASSVEVWTRDRYRPRGRQQ